MSAADIFELIYEIILALLAIVFGLIGVVKYVKCNTEIKGVCLGTKSAIKRNRPKFSYKYNGVVYEEEVSKSLNRYQLRDFTEGEQYNIYINKKNPSKFIAKRWFPIIELSSIILGAYYFYHLLLR